MSDTIFQYGTNLLVAAIGPWHARFIVCGEYGVHPDRVEVRLSNRVGVYNVSVASLPGVNDPADQALADMMIRRDLDLSAYVPSPFIWLECGE